MALFKLWRALRALLRVGLLAAVAVLTLVGLLVVALEMGWGNERLRQLVVSQANQFLDATLTIDRMDGSLLRGVRLEGVQLTREGRPIIAIGRVSVGYSLRQLFARDAGTVIRSLELRGLHLWADRGPDGRWNIASLVRRRTESGPSRPAPPVTIAAITVVDATIDIRSPLTFGALRVPSEIRALRATVALQLRAPAWRLDFAQASWRGRAPDLTVSNVSGVIASGPEGLHFETLALETARSAFIVHGQLRRQPAPSTLGLDVRAERFAFQEWAGILPGLQNIAIESSFTTRLDGPLTALASHLDLRSTGGHIRGTVTLDTTVPGWHGVGRLDVSALDLARWLNRPDRPSDITGHIDFDLDLELGRRFPRGPYTFDGSHVAYLGYEADDLKASGELSEHEALIARATATAYGANLRVDAGAIGIRAPFTYRFTGMVDGVDLRRLPPKVPVPHVESTLSFAYDARGRFGDAVIVGRAQFRPSTFLDMVIGDGTLGTVDTSTRPFSYSGEGDVSEIALQRVGAGLGVAWMRDPRYAGTIAGRFRVAGSGADAATMTLDASGSVRRAELFQGTFSDAEVALSIVAGSLHGQYAGAFSSVQPALALADPRLQASLSGTADIRIDIRDFFTRTVSLADYDVAATVQLDESRVRRLRLVDGEVVATLKDQTLHLATRLDGPALSGRATGSLELDGERSSHVTYVHSPVDLALIGEWLGRPASGTAVGSGLLSGPLSRPHVSGTARLSLPTVARFEATDSAVEYEGTIPFDQPWRSVGRVSGAFERPAIAGLGVEALTAVATFDDRRVHFELRAQQSTKVEAEARGEVLLHADAREMDVNHLALTWRGLTWQTPVGEPTRISWDDRTMAVDALTLVDADSGRQRLGVSGTWGSDAQEGLRLTASGVFLDAFANKLTPPGQAGGLLDAEATVRPSREGTTVVRVTGSVESGRIRRLPFQRLAAQVDYVDGSLDLDGRIDQAPGVWLTVEGRLPLGLLDDRWPQAPMKVALASSAIDLSIVEGVTDVVRDLSGQLQLNLTVVGTSADPHFEGAVDVTGAAFAVRSSGSRYQNGRVSIRLSSDRVVVETFRVEDSRGRALTVSGSLGTHELKVEDLAVDVAAKGFEVLRNEFGTLEVDTALNLRGEFESPKLTGTVTIAGGALNVDEILDRTLLHPYATESAPAPAGVDAFAALNPWDRIGLDVAVHTPGTLRMVGENVQVSPGTPLGLGNVRLRAFGDLYLYKDPARPIFVTGSLDSLVGTYAFQGRRFDIDPASSVIFRGDLNPELYVTVRRTINAVETRVSIVGPLNEPELRLASTPALEASEILSLIVFNSQLNQLSAGQQQELAVRAGTLAAGFLAAPLISAIERSLGLDILEIEAARGDTAGTALGPRVTVGDEIAPGLIARFSRQFGQLEYNEATIEYYISRLFRIRATFSDATDLSASRFRRVERAGIDFLIFFSF